MRPPPAARPDPDTLRAHRQKKEPDAMVMTAADLRIKIFADGADRRGIA
jgi:hypothetical protein